METADEILESVLRIDRPVDACARKYVQVYTECVEVLDEALLAKRDGTEAPDVEKFRELTDKLVKLEDLTIFQFVRCRDVVNMLSKYMAAIDGAEDYGRCVLFFDDIRGRPVNKYVDDEDAEGLDDDATKEPVLGFLEYEKVIPANYTPEFAEFVRTVEDRMKDELDRTLGPDATIQERAAALRDLVLKYVTEYPFYNIHRILSGAIIPCANTDPCVTEGKRTHE